MRVTADTNVVISGLLWRGNPRRVLDAARDGIIELFTSEVLLEELRDVLARERFGERLRAASVSVEVLVEGFAALATVVEPDVVSPVITRDPDDDHVLSCALFAGCEFVVSGDDDLLSLGDYQGIRVLTSAQLVETLLL